MRKTLLILGGAFTALIVLIVIVAVATAKPKPGCSTLKWPQCSPLKWTQRETAQGR